MGMFDSMDGAAPYLVAALERIADAQERQADAQEKIAKALHGADGTSIVGVLGSALWNEGGESFADMLDQITDVVDPSRIADDDDD